MPSIVRWNQPVSALEAFDGFVLPGGFSYQDRVRAGAIAAADEIIEVMMTQSDLGKPVVGICNGAQVLVEAGLVPGLERGRIDLALAPNGGMGRDGYYANWVFVKVSERSRRMRGNLPARAGRGHAHSHRPLRGQVHVVGERALRAPRGRRADRLHVLPGRRRRRRVAFLTIPTAPSGLRPAIANPRGNVVAMMPHPERGAWLRQVPAELAVAVVR